MTLTYGLFDTRFGPAVAWVDESGALVRLHFNPAAVATDAAPRDDRAVAEVALQVEQYASGRRTMFDLPLAPPGTGFQKEVWAELVRLPFGTTTTYGALAARLGRPAAARAVGRANATNPVALVVPCHRVIGSSGSLTGYAGGLTLKKTLLDFERQQTARHPLFEPDPSRGPSFP